MKQTSSVAMWALALTIGCLVSSGVGAADPEAKPSPEQQAQMEKAMESQKPGPEQAILYPLEGSWAYTVKHRMKAGDPVQASSGTSTFTRVLGDHFLRQDLRGEMGGKPFEGLGFIGYDNMKKQYNVIWLDSMTSGVVYGTGQYDPATRTIKEKGEFSCPMTANPHQRYRAEWKLLDNDRHTYTWYMKDPSSSQEFKSMEVAYTRSR